MKKDLAVTRNNHLPHKKKYLMRWLNVCGVPSKLYIFLPMNALFSSQLHCLFSSFHYHNFPLIDVKSFENVKSFELSSVKKLVCQLSVNIYVSCSVVSNVKFGHTRLSLIRHVNSYI